MIRCRKRKLEAADPVSGLPYGWTVKLKGGQEVEWTGLQTGPLTFDEAEIDPVCRHLLGYGRDGLAKHSQRVLVPAIGDSAQLPALILHSTTPDLRTFDGDLDALQRGTRGGDFTTYKEARSVFLAGPEDMAVGRTPAWRAAVEATGARAITLEDQDHYYLSHSLLHLADGYRAGSGSALDQLVEWMRQAPRRVKLYAFEEEMQIFLLWLAKTVGVRRLAVEANRPALSAAWNRKEVLHPTVEEAMELEGELPEEPAAMLAAEHRHSVLASRMGLEVPSLPGYTLVRKGRGPEGFRAQMDDAADLLQDRYGLTHGCFKASESGDGARIFPNIDLDDSDLLQELADAAYHHGDAYVLEAHVEYGRAQVEGQTLPTALSAHIRGGQVAEGVTIQFVEGTSWKGNVLLDKHHCQAFDVPVEHFDRFRSFVADFRQAFEERDPGLVLTGIDAAVGRVGGVFEDTLLLGIQDLNVSFSGAECLRAFLDRARRLHGDAIARCGVTRIYRPTLEADHEAFLEVTQTFQTETVYADTVASIPGRWAMVGISGETPEAAIGNLNRLEAALGEAGLLQTAPESPE